MYQTVLHSLKCTAFVAMSAKGIIGPFWFENDEGETEAVNTERYMEVVRQFLDELRRRWGVRSYPHISNLTMYFLRGVFGDRLITRWATNVWQSYSPDLNPLDLFLLGFFKDRVFEFTRATLVDHKAAVERHIQEIPLASVQKCPYTFSAPPDCLPQKRG